jgi:hypothetical protein
MRMFVGRQQSNNRNTMIPMRNNGVYPMFFFMDAKWFMGKSLTMMDEQ